jgi:polyisoprenoid-binding protein YceI
MHRRLVGSLLALLVLSLWTTAPARAADYTIDTAHSGVNFKISHAGLAWIFGRFNEFSGNFTIDPDEASKCSFSMTIQARSVDTNNKKRDDHLRSGDFFNIKQYPTLSFKSTSVKAVKGGYQVTGDFTLHGVAKSITFKLVGGRTAEFPKGVQRTGFSTELSIKRSDFGMKKGLEFVGDEVYLSISFEGTKK